MQTLLVEDDEFKQTAIQAELQNMGLNFIFDVQRSVHGAIERINSNNYELILLDMSLPSHNLILGKGAPVPMPSGGMEVIMELGYLKNRQEKIIILTQYPEIEIDNKLFKLSEAKKKILTDYYIPLLDIIRFKREKPEWRTQLTAAIRGSF